MFACWKSRILMPKVAIGSDHAGFSLKQLLKKWLEGQGFEVQDVGTHSAERADYPDFAHAVGEAVGDGAVEWGVVICGSGNGVCMTANKHRGVRAALAWNEEIARLAKAHNNANVICLPARFIHPVDAVTILYRYLHTEFEGGRHQRRVEKIG